MRYISRVIIQGLAILGGMSLYRSYKDRKNNATDASLNVD
jgi:hypothetical protein